MSGKLVLVTGASGYIATHVVQQLQQEGYRVRGTVRSTKNEAKCEPLRKLCPDAAYPLELVEADLTVNIGWHEAVKDCEYVIHTASPFPLENPRDEDELIKPAVDGTLRVLRAIRDHKTVKRCVLTSSCAAVFGNSMGEDGKIYNEENWTDPKKQEVDAYSKSKTMAELAAWEFVKDLSGKEGEFELAVINPVLVFGPVLCGGAGTSMNLIKQILERETPMIPNINFPCVDVRDVAKAHVVAMTLPEASGKRHCLYANSIWFKDIAKALSDEFKTQGYNPPSSLAPKWMMWIMSKFNAQARAIYPTIGITFTVDNTRMKDVLGIQPRDISSSVVEMGYSMIEAGFIQKTSKYHGPPGKETK